MSRTPRSEPLSPKSRWSIGLAAGVLLALAPGALRAQVPETHTVKAGDTLWDLAKQYLGDPFLWPEIYRLNTLVVEDPHWIYPGEVLRIAPSEKATAVPQQAEAPAPAAAVAPPPAAPPGAEAAPAPAPTEARPGLAEVAPEQQAPAEAEQQAPSVEELPDTTHLFPLGRGLTTVELLVGDRGASLRPLHRSDFYSSGFLTEGDPMPFGVVHGPTTPSDIPTNEPRSSTTLYSRIAIDAPAGATYQVGDTLLVANVRGTVEGYGRIVEPRGLARVLEISQGAAISEVVAVYGEILPGQATLPAEKFTDPGAVKPVPVSKGVAAEVIGWPGHREFKGQGIVVFLDKGKQDGVAPGDVFEVRRTPGRHSDGAITIADVMATLQVVHVRDHTATTRVMGVVSPNLHRGSHATQVAKLPS